MAAGGAWATGDSSLGVRETFVSGECFEAPYPYRRGDKADPAPPSISGASIRAGPNWLFADGSVRFLSYGANDILPALATRAGGESVEVP